MEKVTVLAATARTLIVMATGLALTGCVVVPAHRHWVPGHHNWRGYWVPGHYD